MGIIPLEPTQSTILALAKINRSTIFIETGTFTGGMTLWASNHFKTVHTIEISQYLYNIHSPQLARVEGITPHLGDSREVLPQIVEKIADQRAIYWLDGHWSGGDTGGEKDECPLLGELHCLTERTEDIILIDDARLFLCAPPLPYDPSLWPTIQDIVNVFQKADKFVQIVDDVIFIIPNEHALKNHLIDHTQSRSTSFWKAFSENQK